MSEWKFFVLIVSFLLFVPFTSAQLVESGFGSDYVQGICGGDLPQICKDNGFSLPEGFGAPAGVGVGQVICVLPSGNLSYQYGCNIDPSYSPQTLPIFDKSGNLVRDGTWNSNSPFGSILFSVIGQQQTYTTISPYLPTNAIPPFFATLKILDDSEGLVRVVPTDLKDYSGSSINLTNEACVGDISSYIPVSYSNFPNILNTLQLFSNPLALPAVGLKSSTVPCSGPIAEELKYDAKIYETPNNVHLYPSCLSKYPTGTQQWIARITGQCEPDHGLRPVLPIDSVTGNACWGWPNKNPLSASDSPEFFCEQFGLEYKDKLNDYIDGIIEWYIPTIDPAQKTASIQTGPFSFSSPFDVALSQCGLRAVIIKNPAVTWVMNNIFPGFTIPPCGGPSVYDYFSWSALDITCRATISFDNPDYLALKTSNNWPKTNYVPTTSQNQCLQTNVGSNFVRKDPYEFDWVYGQSTYNEIQFHRPIITSIEVTDVNGNPLQSKDKVFSHNSSPSSINDTFNGKTLSHFSVNVGQKVKIKFNVTENDAHDTVALVFPFPGLGARHITAPGPTSLARCDYFNSVGCLNGTVSFNGTSVSGNLYQNIGKPKNTEIEFEYEIPSEYRDYSFNSIPLVPGDSYQVFLDIVDEFGSASDVAVFFEITPPVCDNSQIDLGETDVDCGGFSCGQCGLADRCEQDSDCLSGFCFIDPSVPAVQTGTITSSGKIRSGTGYGQGICRTASSSTTVISQCQENWVTSPWSACVSGSQTRIVTDTNSCNNSNPVVTKPDEQRSCVNLASCVPSQSSNVCGGTSNGCAITSYNNGISCGTNNTGVCFGGNCYVGSASQTTCWTADWTDCELHNINGQKGFYKIRNKNPQKLAGPICTTISPSDRAGAAQKCSLQSQVNTCQQSLVSSGFDPKLSTDFDSLSSLSNVAGFKIGNQYAHIQYIDPVDLSGVSCSNLANIFNFELNKAFVDTENSPQLNKQSLLTFFTQGIKDPTLKDDKGKCVDAFVVKWDESTGIFTSRVSGFSGYSVVESSECNQQIPLSLLLLLILIPIGAIAWFLFYTYYKKGDEGKTLWQNYLARRASE